MVDPTNVKPRARGSEAFFGGNAAARAHEGAPYPHAILPVAIAISSLCYNISRTHPQKR